MKGSTEVQNHIKLLNSTIIGHQVTTTIIAGKLQKIGSDIQDATAHHWWDLFTGYSPSATKMLNFLVHPVLVLCIITAILSIWNCVMAYKVFCRKPPVVMASYVA